MLQSVKEVLSLHWLPMSSKNTPKHLLVRPLLVAGALLFSSQSLCLAQSLYPAHGDSSSILPSTTPPVQQAPQQPVCPPGMSPNGLGGFSPSVPGMGGPSSIPGLGYEIPVPAGFKQAPKFDPGMWNSSGGGFASKGYLGAGTVLTAILEQDLTSNKSKVGEIFSFRLEDGYSPDNGVTYIIPKQSKIVCAVTAATSAKKQRGGPGTLDITLQTLVFPDGRSCPFWGFIQQNTNHKMTKNSDLAKTTAGYGTRTVSSALNMVTGRVGFGMNVPRYGNDFKLEQGEVIPIKTSRLMNLNEMAPPPRLAQAGTAGGVGIGPGGVGTGPGAGGFNNGGFNGGGFNGGGLNNGGGFGAPATMQSMNQKPIELSAGPAKSLNPDPNEIFNQPLQQSTPINQMPEPF